MRLQPERPFSNLPWHFNVNEERAIGLKRRGNMVRAEVKGNGVTVSDGAALMLEPGERFQLDHETATSGGIPQASHVEVEAPER